MAFEMLPASNVEKGRMRSSNGYASLTSPPDHLTYEHPYHHSIDVPSSANLKPDPSRSRSDFGADTSYDAYGSHTELNRGYPHPHTGHGRPWQPGVFEQLPWFGISALVGTVLCTFAAVVVLLVSNREPINNWAGEFQPTVYLSIFTALANILLTYALYQGIVISFWRKAGQGTTLLELHQYWSSGTSFYGAIRGIFLWRGKTVAIACIMTITSILRGPLMQRASSVENITTFTNGSTTVHAAQQLPLGWAGTDSGRTVSPSYMNPNFTTVLQGYYNRGLMNIVHADCGSECQTTIKGFGFGVECNMTKIKYSLEPGVYPNGSVYNLPTVEAFATSASTIDVFGHGEAAELDYYGNPTPKTPTPGSYQNPNTALLLNSTFFQNATNSYNGTMAQHLCALRGGIVSYPISIANGTVTLQSTSWRNDTFLEDRGLLPLTYGSQSNIAGFVLAANNLYQSSSTFQFGGGVGWILNLNGLLANQYLNRFTSSDNYYYLDTNITWRDPMEDMINGMRELAFRSALDIAAKNLTFPDSAQQVLYTGTQPETVYTANYHYMASAVIVSLLGVFAVIPTFRGWWELGRRVTLSPLEVAKAFDAPLLGGAESNAGAETMLKEIGMRRVRYGDVGTAMQPEGVAVGGGGRKLQITEAELVRPPVKGLRYA